MKKSLTIVIASALAVLFGLTVGLFAQSVGQASDADELPIVSESESNIEVRNIYATDVSQSSATLNITFKRMNVTEFTVMLGSDPKQMKAAGTKSVGKAASAISMSVDGLAEHTRYYYCFVIVSDGVRIKSDTWSFVTPDDYYNGSDGGSSDEPLHGIDVSFWNGSIDFEKLSEQGVDFVILRAGSSKGKDRCFEEHYEQARAAGLRLGVYFYTYAMDMEGIVRDAENFLEYLNGKYFDLPVYLDFEDSTQEESLSPRLLTEMSIEFCERVADAGYYPGIYANSYWFNNCLNFETLSSVYELWVASWTKSGKPDGDFSKKFGMWQYYDDGRIDGVPEQSDLNVCYKDYSEIIRNERTVEYSFLSGDGELLRKAHYRVGEQILPPDLDSSKECDELFEYTFEGWVGLDENNIAKEGGGSFKAAYEKKSHSFGTSNAQTENEIISVCSNCGYEKRVYVGDMSIGDGLEWSLEEGVLTVSGSGAMRDGDAKSGFPWSVRADEVRKLTVSEGVTAIGNYAFAGLRNLTEVKLPYSLVRIGSSAFSGDLELCELAIHAGVKSIGADAFDGCASLWRIKGYDGSAAEAIAEELEIEFLEYTPWLKYSGSDENGIGWYLYSDGSLYFAGFGKISADIGYKKYQNRVLKVVIGAGISELCDFAFEDFTALEQVDFLGGALKVGDFVFVGCEDLTTVDIPVGSTVAPTAFDGSGIPR